MQKTFASGCTGDKCVSECGKNWEENGEHCYYWSTNPRTWKAAERFCQKKGGHLASISSDVIRRYVLKGMGLNNYHKIWLGGTDKEEEGAWSWSDCTPFDYTSWGNKQPSNGGGHEDCMEMIGGSYKGKWNDISCRVKRDFLCSQRKCIGRLYRTNSLIKQPKSFKYASCQR